MSTVTFFTSVQDQLQFVEQRIREQAGEEHHPDLRSALEHLLSAGGKRIRPTLGLLVGNMLGAPEEKLITLGASVELLHTATLVHDDLIDGALLRRGMPTLNARWSPAATVLTGDFLFRARRQTRRRDRLPAAHEIILRNARYHRQRRTDADVLRPRRDRTQQLL